MAAIETYILLVTVGRSADDGLPKKATGGALLCYAAGRDEEEAVRETVAVLRDAGMSPLEVESHGTEAEFEDASDEERELMARARTENAVMIIQSEALYD